MTFWIQKPIRDQLRNNAKQESLSLPDYLAFLVQRGLTIKAKRSAK